jgi:hypothetical protein
VQFCLRYEVHLVVLLKEIIAIYSENHMDHVIMVLILYLVVHTCIVSAECEGSVAFRFCGSGVTMVLT